MSAAKADPQEDLALDSGAGQAAAFGDSDNMQIGDTVIAIGDEGVSAGIVSALHRQVTVGGGAAAAASRWLSQPDHVRRRDTDPIVDQPAVSGGALFEHGRSGRRHQQRHRDRIECTPRSVGIGFAISSNDAQKFIGSAVSS